MRERDKREKAQEEEVEEVEDRRRRRCKQGTAWEGLERERETRGRSRWATREQRRG